MLLTSKFKFFDKATEGRKRKKYAAIASRHDAELLPFVIETCGGLGPDALANCST